MLRTSLRLLVASALVLAVTGAVKPDPVKWTASASPRRADGTVELTVRAVIENGWYIYSMRQPENGPAPLRFRTPAAGGTVGNVSAPEPRVSYDRGFRARVGKYYGAPVFRVAVRPAGQGAIVPIEIRYQACNDTICLPPRTRKVEARVARR